MINEGVAEIPELSELPSRVKGRRALMVSLTVPGAAGRPVPTISRAVPSADFPTLPTLSLEAFRPYGAARVPSVLDAGTVVQVTAGRFAISLALQAMGVGKGDEVLVPAYHCTTMVEPVLQAGARPVFFRLNDDLSPDFGDVAAKIKPTTRVMMLTHYFGFPQDATRARAFCDARGLRFLEDCAHAFFGEVSDRPIGSFGDFAIASPTKFFPVKDGGCLVCNDGVDSRFALHQQGLRASAATAAAEIQRAVYYGNLPVLRPFLALARLLRNLARETGDAAGSAPVPGAAAYGAEVDAASDFDASRIHVAMTGFSAWVCRHANQPRITARRRQNYELMVKELQGVAGVRAFRPDLPEHVVPYEVPFWVDDLKRHFPRLEDLAVPMHRFGQFLHPAMAEGSCAVSETLSRHLMQLPCHQDLSDDDIRQIAARVRLVLES